VALAPDLRDRVERAVARLRDGTARQGDVDRATAELYRTVVDGGERRAAAARVLAVPADPAFQEVVRAAGRGDGAGAAAAASDLAGRLRGEPGSGGMPPADRERLADDLEGAGAQARKAGLADLGDGLRTAADAARKPDEQTGQVFRSLAATIADALGQGQGGHVPVALSGIRQARIEAGLPPEPASPAPTGVGPAPPTVPAGGPSVGGPTPPLEAGGGAVAIPPDVRPEDRAVVRRYFGG
jgi:hypothetical protein